MQEYRAVWCLRIIQERMWMAQRSQKMLWPLTSFPAKPWGDFLHHLCTICNPLLLQVMVPHAITCFCLHRTQGKLFHPPCRGDLKPKVFLGRNNFFHVRCRSCYSSGSWEKMKGTASHFKSQILMFSLRSKRNSGKEGKERRDQNTQHCLLWRHCHYISDLWTQKLILSGWTVFLPVVKLITRKFELQIPSLQTKEQAAFLSMIMLAHLG